MANTHLVHDGAKTIPPANGQTTAFAEEAGPAPETAEPLIERAKDIIAGRTQPPALAVPPEIEQFLQREFEGREPQPTTEALRRITERLYLEAHYGGQPVACFTTPAGTLAVLAAGDQQVTALLHGLSGEERAKVLVTDTVQF